MADTKDIRRMIATATIGDGDQVLNILEKICDRLDAAATAAPVEQPKARYEKAHDARYRMTHPVHPDIVVLWFLALKSHWFDDSKNMFYGQREQAKAYLYKWVETGQLADDCTTLEIATAMKFREWLASSWTTAPLATPQEEAPIRREIRSSRHPHFTHADHERMKETLDSLSDYPTEEEAEAVLQACGTSGKEVVNEFIERLLKENLELKTKLDAATKPSGAAREAAEEIANAYYFCNEDARANWKGREQEVYDDIAAIIEHCFSDSGSDGRQEVKVEEK